MKRPVLFTVMATVVIFTLLSALAPLPRHPVAYDDTELSASRRLPPTAHIADVFGD